MSSIGSQSPNNTLSGRGNGNREVEFSDFSEKDAVLPEVDDTRANANSSEPEGEPGTDNGPNLGDAEISGNRPVTTVNATEDVEDVEDSDYVSLDQAAP